MKVNIYIFTLRIYKVYVYVYEDIVTRRALAHSALGCAPLSRHHLAWLKASPHQPPPGFPRLVLCSPPPAPRSLSLLPLHPSLLPLSSPHHSSVPRERCFPRIYLRAAAAMLASRVIRSEREREMRREPGVGSFLLVLLGIFCSGVVSLRRCSLRSRYSQLFRSSSLIFYLSSIFPLLLLHLHLILLLFNLFQTRSPRSKSGKPLARTLHPLFLGCSIVSYASLCATASKPMCATMSSLERRPVLLLLLDQPFFDTYKLVNTLLGC